MKKRVLAGLLWFYAMWYAGAMVAQVFGWSPALGPILGFSSAALIAGDPRHLIWSKVGKAPEAGVTPTATPQSI